MITGISSIKKDKIANGDGFYLIASTTVHHENEDKHILLVLDQEYSSLETHECGSVEAMLEMHNATVAKYNLKRGGAEIISAPI